MLENRIAGYGKENLLLRTVLFLFCFGPSDTKPGHNFQGPASPKVQSALLEADADVLKNTANDTRTLGRLLNISTL